MKPLVGITIEIRDGVNYMLPPMYGQAVTQAGGIPLLIPLMPDEDLEDLCERIDALIVVGGEDIDPSYYGEEPLLCLEKVTPEVDRLDYTLIQTMLKLDKPIIGLCKGLHMLNIALGGNLYQSIHDQIEKPLIQHRQKAKRTHRAHSVTLETSSRMYDIFKEAEFRVNTFHHQACRVLGKGLKVAARASDGIVEGVESTQHSFVFGFQWHPEDFALEGDEPSKRLFSAFIEAAQQRKNLNPTNQ